MSTNFTDIVPPNNSNGPPSPRKDVDVPFTTTDLVLGKVDAYLGGLDKEKDKEEFLDRLKNRPPLIVLTNNPSNGDITSAYRSVIDPFSQDLKNNLNSIFKNLKPEEKIDFIKKIRDKVSAKQSELKAAAATQPTAIASSTTVVPPIVTTTPNRPIVPPRPTRPIKASPTPAAANAEAVKEAEKNTNVAAIIGMKGLLENPRIVGDAEGAARNIKNALLGNPATKPLGLVFESTYNSDPNKDLDPLAALQNAVMVTTEKALESAKAQVTPAIEAAEKAIKEANQEVEEATKKVKALATVPTKDQGINHEKASGQATTAQELAEKKLKAAIMEKAVAEALGPVADKAAKEALAALGKPTPQTAKKLPGKLDLKRLTDFKAKFEDNRRTTPPLSGGATMINTSMKPVQTQSETALTANNTPVPVNDEVWSKIKDAINAYAKAQVPVQTIKADPKKPDIITIEKPHIEIQRQKEGISVVSKENPPNLDSMIAVFKEGAKITGLSECEIKTKKPDDAVKLILDLNKTPPEPSIKPVISDTMKNELVAKSKLPNADPKYKQALEIVDKPTPGQKPSP